jgi:gamma-glutamyl-gamma-aminobutyrate hydrolase PuuD
MEMAIRFRKPVITSDLQYFREILEMFPSFGYSCKSNDYGEYLNLFKKIIEPGGRDDQPKLYTESDLEKFNGFKDPENFLNKLENVLSQVL